MNESRELIRLLAEEENLDTDGTLEALVGFFRDSDLAAETIAVLSDWMERENLSEELTAWMQGRGLIVQQSDEEIE